MLRFRAPVTREGGKSSSIRVTVPKKTVAALQLPAPCWVRIRVNGSEHVFAWARRPPSRNSVDVGLTHRLFPLSLAKKEVDVDIEHAKPYRALTWTPQKGFDWLRFVEDEHYFPTETVDGRLLLHNRHEEPFALKRITPPRQTYRMLGLYQAEGSYSDTSVDFSYANTNAMLLQHSIDLLRTWGLERDRLALTVLREEGEDPAAARAVYACLGLPPGAERVRSGAGEHAALIQVRKSMPLRRLVGAALEHTFTNPFPSTELALAFALGWLDGDGSITRRGGSDDLVLSGLEDEHAVVKRALADAFGWTYESGSYYKGSDEGTRITLRMHEMVDLLDARAFEFSMSRVRLFLAFGERAHRLREAVEGRRVRGVYTQHGLLSEGIPTARGERVLEAETRYRQSIETAKVLWRDRPELFNKKCEPYPPEMDGA